MITKYTNKHSMQHTLMGKMFAITAIMQLMLMSKDIKAFYKKSLVW